MATAGITKQVLQETFKKSGPDGIRILFSESVNGKARITTNKKILEKIYKLFWNALKFCTLDTNELNQF